MQGQIQEETRERRFWGGRLLLALAIATLIVGIVVGGQDLLRQLIAVLMPFILLAGLILLVPLLLGRGGSGGMLQVGSGMARGAAGLARVGASGVRGSAGLLGRSGSSTFLIHLRRFRIQDVLGATTSCVLVGEVFGDVMRQGDLVQVAGHKNRDGVINTSLVKVLDSPDGPPRLVVRAQLSLGFQVARVADVLAKGLSIGLAVLVVVMLVGWSNSR